MGVSPCQVPGRLTWACHCWWPWGLRSHIQAIRARCSPSARWVSKLPSSLKLTAEVQEAGPVSCTCPGAPGPSHAGRGPLSTHFKVPPQLSEPGVNLIPSRCPEEGPGEPETSGHPALPWALRCPLGRLQHTHRPGCPAGKMVGLALTREVGGAEGSVAVEFGGVDFRRATAAAGWRRVASQEVTFSQQAWGEKTYGPGWDPMTQKPPAWPPPHHGSLLLLQARFPISRGVL